MVEPISTIKEPSPSVKWAVAELEKLLGQEFDGTVATVLSQLEQEAYEFGYEQAQFTVGDWNKP